MSTKAQRDQAEALDYLRAWFTDPPADETSREYRNYFTVWTMVRHVSASGMVRWLTPVIVRDGQPVRLGFRAATALGWGWSDRYEGVKVDGAGMDMGFHLVYTMSRAMFANGTSPRIDGGTPLTDSGYVLNSERL